MAFWPNVQPMDLWECFHWPKFTRPVSVEYHYFITVWSVFLFDVGFESF